MRVTLLGHASLLVEMAGTTCLMDPVFFDPFEEGATVSCPARVVYPDRIAPVDILIVSHRHPDHFDLASLDRIPRQCDAICPADPLIVYGLRKLGFERIHPVEPMGELLLRACLLAPLRHALRAPARRRADRHQAARPAGSPDALPLECGRGRSDRRAPPGRSRARSDRRASPPTRGMNLRRPAGSAGESISFAALSERVMHGARRAGRRGLFRREHAGRNDAGEACRRRDQVDHDDQFEGQRVAAGHIEQRAAD